MKRLTYRIWVDVDDTADLAQVQREFEDSLETLPDGLTASYVLIGTATGLVDPAPPVRPAGDPCGAADRFSCVCDAEPVQPAGLPQGVYKSGADL